MINPFINHKQKNVSRALYLQNIITTIRTNVNNAIKIYNSTSKLNNVQNQLIFSIQLLVRIPTTIVVDNQPRINLKITVPTINRFLMDTIVFHAKNHNILISKKINVKDVRMIRHSVHSKNNALMQHG